MTKILTMLSVAIALIVSGSVHVQAQVQREYLKVIMPDGAIGEVLGWREGVYVRFYPHEQVAVPQRQGDLENGIPPLDSLNQPSKGPFKSTSGPRADAITKKIEEGGNCNPLKIDPFKGVERDIDQWIEILLGIALVTFIGFQTIKYFKRNQR